MNIQKLPKTNCDVIISLLDYLIKNATNKTKLLFSMKKIPNEDGKSECEAELKIVTLLFFDLVNSMGLVSELNAEEASEFLTSTIGKVTDVVHRFGGFTSTLAGDGALFVFGAPLGSSRHASNACLAALELLNLHSFKASDGRAVEFRIGLSSGEALVQPIKTDIGWHYDVTGFAVHMGSRMESLAEPGSIYATRTVAKLADPGFKFIKLKPQKVQGLKEPVEPYRLDGIGNSDISQPIHPPDFFGRTAELARLFQICKEAKQDKPKVVLVTGDAGIGKSRLTFEFFKKLHTLKEFNCAFYKGFFGFLEPFSAVEDCMDQLKNDDQKDEHVAGNGIATPASSQQLTENFDISEKEAHSNSNPPSSKLKYEQIKDRIIRVLENIDENSKPIFVLDEFLEFDSASLEIIFELLTREMGNSPVFIVSARDEAAALNAIGFLNEIQIIRLKPLENNHSRDLFLSLVGHSSKPIRNLEFLLQCAQGNPLFVRELYAYCSGFDFDFSSNVNNDLMSNDISRVPLLTSIISERVDRLDVESKTVLKICSILGEVIPKNVLLYLLGTMEINKNKLEILVNRRLLQIVLKSGFETFQFVHPLVRETVKSSIVSVERKDIHRAAFNALNEVSDLGDYSAAYSKAYHAENSELWGEAIFWLRAAGLLLNERAMNRQALDLFEKAIRIAGKLQDSEVRAKSEVDLLIEMRNPLFQMGDLRRVSSLLQRAKIRSKESFDFEQRGKILACESHVAWLTGNPAKAQGCAREAVEIASQIDSEALAARGRFHLALSMLAGGKIKSSITNFYSVKKAFQKGVTSQYLGVSVELNAVSNSYYSRALLENGQFEKATKMARNAVALANKSGDLLAQVIANLSAGIVYFCSGRIKEGAHYFLKAISNVKMAEAKLMKPVCEGHYGFMVGTTDDLSQGYQIIKRSIQESESFGFKFHSGVRYIYLCLLDMLRGEIETASKHADKAVFESIATGEKRTELCAKKLANTLSTNQSMNYDDVAKTFSVVAVQYPSFACCLAALGTTD